MPAAGPDAAGDLPGVRGVVWFRDLALTQLAVVGIIPEQMPTVGGDPTTLDLASSFSDPDGDPFSYRAVSDSTAVVQASVSGSALTLTAVATGTAEVTVPSGRPGGLR